MGSQSVCICVILGHYFTHTWFPIKVSSLEIFDSFFVSQMFAEASRKSPSCWSYRHKPLHATDIPRYESSQGWLCWPNVAQIFRACHHFNKFGVFYFLFQLRSQTDAHLKGNLHHSFSHYFTPMQDQTCGRLSNCFPHRLKQSLPKYWHCVSFKKTTASDCWVPLDKPARIGLKWSSTTP